jgi:hypothetical protein
MKTIAEFNKIYETLGDAVLKNISISYISDPTQIVIRVVVDCMSTLKDYDWVYLELSFYDVQEFKVVSLMNRSIVVVESFSAAYLDNLIVFNFSPNVIPPESITEHRDSLFYIICKEFDFKEINSFKHDVIST